MITVKCWKLIIQLSSKTRCNSHSGTIWTEIFSMLLCNDMHSSLCSRHRKKTTLPMQEPQGWLKGCWYQLFLVCMDVAAFVAHTYENLHKFSHPQGLTQAKTFYFFWPRFDVGGRHLPHSSDWQTHHHQRRTLALTR